MTKQNTSERSLGFKAFAERVEGDEVVSKFLSRIANDLEVINEEGVQRFDPAMGLWAIAMMGLWIVVKKVERVVDVKLATWQTDKMAELAKKLDKETDCGFVKAMELVHKLLEGISSQSSDSELVKHLEVLKKLEVKG